MILLFSHSVISDSLWPHGLQHARLPCPSPIPRACSNSCPSSQWCHPAISSSIIPFSSHLQYFPASGSFPTSQLFASGGHSIAASASVLPMNIQGWLPLGLTGLISLQSKGLSRVFSNTTAWENVHHIANGHLLRKKMYLCKYLPIWYLELCYKSRAWAFSPLILIGKHQVGTISGPHFTERELTLGSLGKSPKVSSRVHSEVHLLFCNVKDTCVAGHVSEVKTTSVPQACSCGYSLLREQRRDQGTQQSWICHTSCS